MITKKTKVMKTIKNTISTLAIILISFKSFAQEVNYSIAKADSLMIGLYVPSKGDYEFTQYGKDTTDFIFCRNILKTTGNRFEGFDQHEYRDDSCIYNVRSLIDDNGESCSSVIISRNDMEFTLIEIRYPQICFRYKLKNLE